MEPAGVRVLWVQKEAGAGPGSHRPGGSPVLSLCRGAQAIRVGSACAVWDGRVRNRFHLKQLNPTSAPLECHFALYLGVSPGTLSLVLSPVLFQFRVRREEKAFRLCHDKV